MMFLKSSAVFFIACIVAPWQLYAQEAVELNPVTVTATLTPTTQSQTGRNLIVIDGARLQQLPVHSIDELLRYVPGIEVQARGPMGTQSDFVMRGSTFQQTLVILDGLRLNDPITGHFSSYIPIAPAEIERIEILKGASSAIYGSDAVGGVIHIITRSFAQKQNGLLQKGASANLATGEWGLVNVAAGGYYKAERTAVAGGYQSNNAMGQPLRGTRGFFHLHTGSLSASHHINNYWQIGGRLAWDSRRFGAQNYYTTSPADTADESVKTFWSQLRIQYQKGKGKLSLHGSLKKIQDDFRFNSASAPNTNKSNLAQALAVYEKAFLKSSYLTTGLQFQNRRIRSNDRGNHAVAQAAAFAVLKQSIAKLVTLTPALRLDWDERSGTELIPQLNVSYKIAAFQLRGSIGKTIRQADFTERYNNYNRAAVPGLSRVGNPDLGAETALNYEAGADLFLGKNLKIAATYFRRDYNDLIDFASTPYSDMPRRENLNPAGTYFLAKNIAAVTTTGFETDAVFSKNLQKQRRLFATFGLVVLNSETGDGPPSLYLSSYARFLTNFALAYTAPRWSLSASSLYKRRNEQSAAAIKAALSKDYFVMHAKADVFVIKKMLSLFVQVDNIFDRPYSDLLGAQMPRRWLMGGVKWTL